MVTLVDTLAAVRELLAPLVPGTLAVVLDGPQAQMNELPAAEVRFGQGDIAWEPTQRILERRQTETGVIRVYVKQGGDLGNDFPKVAPLIDAVAAMLMVTPVIPNIADRFDYTGHSGVGQETIGNQLYLYVDVRWRSISIEAGAYVQDWV